MLQSLFQLWMLGFTLIFGTCIKLIQVSIPFNMSLKRANQKRLDLKISSLFEFYFPFSVLRDAKPWKWVSASSPGASTPSWGQAGLLLSVLINTPLLPFSFWVFLIISGEWCEWKPRERKCRNTAMKKSTEEVWHVAASVGVELGRESMNNFKFNFIKQRSGFPVTPSPLRKSQVCRFELWWKRHAETQPKAPFPLLSFFPFFFFLCL